MGSSRGVVVCADLRLRSSWKGGDGRKVSGGGDDGGGRQIQSLDMSRSVGERRTEEDAYCSRFNSLHMPDPSVLIGSSCRLYTRWSMCLSLLVHHCTGTVPINGSGEPAD